VVRAAIHRVWRSGPAGTVGHFYIATTNGVPTSFWTDNGPVSSVTPSRTTPVLPGQVSDHVETDAQLRRPLRSVPQRLPEQRFGLNGNEPCVDDRLRHRSVRRQTGHAGARRRDVQHAGPAIAVIYDLFGDSKTALKASWGRYRDESGGDHSPLVNPIDLVTKKYAWDTTT
jgi:hypothetical protein